MSSLYIEYPTDPAEYIEAVPDSADTTLQPVYLRLSMTIPPARLYIVSDADTETADYLGHLLAWEIPPLTLPAMRHLMDRLARYARRIVDGYSYAMDWERGHLVARYNSDAREAQEAIEGILDRYDPEPAELIHAMEPADYLAPSMDWTPQGVHVGDQLITANTPGAHIRAWAESLTREAEAADVYLLHPIETYLEGVREAVALGGEA